MPTKREEERYEIDPTDGLRREIVGEWVQEKHRRLCHYVDISRAARRKFHGNCTFIDLYCGPGRARIKNTTTVIPGGAVAAASEAAKHDPFGKIYIGDLDATNLEACEQRLAQERLGPVFTFEGTAEATARAIPARTFVNGSTFCLPRPVQRPCHAVLDHPDAGRAAEDGHADPLQHNGHAAQYQGAHGRWETRQLRTWMARTHQSGRSQRHITYSRSSITGMG